MKLIDRTNLLTITFVLLIFLWGGYAYKNSVRYETAKTYDVVVIRDLGAKTNDGFIELKQDRVIGVDQTADRSEALSGVQCGGTCRGYKYWSYKEQLWCDQWPKEITNVYRNELGVLPNQSSMQGTSK